MTNLLEVFREFPVATLVGVLIAALCSFLGVFVVLKRMVFIGITLSEAAACGVALAMLCHLHPMLGAAIFTLVVVALLAFPFESLRLPNDAVLGIVFVGTASLSILLVAKSGFGLEEVKAMLYGDLLFTTPQDLLLVGGITVGVMAYLLIFLRPTLYGFLDREAAKVLGIRVVVWDILFFCALGLAISAASKVAGAVLVFCYLVVPSSTALVLSKKLWVVLGLAVAIGVLSTFLGMLWAGAHDLPANQAIGFVHCCVFAVAFLWRGLLSLLAWIRPGRPGDPR